MPSVGACTAESRKCCSSMRSVYIDVEHEIGMINRSKVNVNSLAQTLFMRCIVAAYLSGMKGRGPAHQPSNVSGRAVGTPQATFRIYFFPLADFSEPNRTDEEVGE